MRLATFLSTCTTGMSILPSGVRTSTLIAVLDVSVASSFIPISSMESILVSMAGGEIEMKHDSR